MQHKILSIAEQNFLNLSSIKTYLRISHDYDDVWITELIDASISAAESFLRMQLLARNVEMRIESIYKTDIPLTLIPVVDVIKVTAHFGEQNIILQKEEYVVQAQQIKLKNLPLHDYITVEYVAGFPNQATIPAALRQGIQLHVAEMYDSRGSVASISNEVQKLYQPYRQMKI